MFYFCSPIQYNVVMDFSIKVKDYSEVCVGSVADLLPRLLPDKRVIVISDTNIDRYYHSMLEPFDHILIGLLCPDLSILAAAYHNCTFCDRCVSYQGHRKNDSSLCIGSYLRRISVEGAKYSFGGLSVHFENGTDVFLPLTHGIYLKAVLSYALCNHKALAELFAVL